MKRTYARGDIYYADLTPVIGSEQDGIRPVLIVQNDIGNAHSPTVIIAPITTQCKMNLPTHVFINSILKFPSIVLLEQLRTIDKQRILEFAGRLDEKQMQEVNKKMSISLALSFCT